MGKKAICVIYILLSIIILLFWLGLLFYGFFLGGSPGPGYERTVPLPYVGVIALGFLGAVLGLLAGINCVMANPAKIPVFQYVAGLGVIGSIPFFLLDLAAVGMVSLLVSIPTPLLYASLTQEKHKEEEI